MTDTDKIVAAILASGYAAAKSSGDAGVELNLSTRGNDAERKTHKEAQVRHDCSVAVSARDDYCQNHTIR